MPGVHPERGERHAQLGVLGRVPQVAGQRQRQPGADRRPVDRGDGRDLEVTDRQPGRGRTAASGCAARRRDASGSAPIQDTSPPEQNALPSPVTTTARTSGSAPQPAIARAPRRGHRRRHHVAPVRQVEGHQDHAVGRSPRGWATRRSASAPTAVRRRPRDRLGDGALGGARGRSSRRPSLVTLRTSTPASHAQRARLL